MGHSAETNEQIYTKALPDTLRDVVEIVGKDLFGDEWI